MLLLEAPCCLLENDPILLLRWICQAPTTRLYWDVSYLAVSVPCNQN